MKSKYIAAANELGKEEFDKKYPSGAEVELKGKVRFPATQGDKIDVKFASRANKLPLAADFMFAANGGSKESAQEKVKTGEEVHFKGTVEYCFFDKESRKIKNRRFKDFIAL